MMRNIIANLHFFFRQFTGHIVGFSRALPLMLLFAAAGAFAANDIYQWTDEQGKVHFGDRKLDSVKQTKLDVRTEHGEWQRYAIAVETIDVELSKAERERIVDDVNNVYRFFDDMLFFDMYKTVPVSIRIYPNAKAYNDYLKTVSSGPMVPSWGVFLRQQNSIVVFIQPQRAATFETIKHETSHAIVATITPFTTAWLDEGLAEQMETLTLRNGRLTIARHPENSGYVQRLRAQGSGLLGLDKLFALRSDQWRSHYSDSGVPLQCQTGELIYFLLATPPGRNFIVRMLHRYERGTTSAGMQLSNTLVEQEYLGGIPVMQADWNHWLLDGGTERIEM